MMYLGHGTGRVVFKIDDDRVVKIPYNISGVEQNKQEFEAKNDYYTQTYELDDNNWLYAEYVNDCSQAFDDYVTDGIHCTKYDDCVDIQIKFNCDFDCKNCKYNNCSNFGDVSEFLKHKPKDRLQVGLDKNGNLKYYDYAEYSVDKNSLFHNGMLDAFNIYLKEKNYDVLFIDWLKQNNVSINKPVFTDEELKFANKMKRRFICKRKCCKTE